MSLMETLYQSLVVVGLLEVGTLISWDIQDYNGTVLASGCHPSAFLCSYTAPSITVTCPSSSTTHVLQLE